MLDRTCEKSPLHLLVEIGQRNDAHVCPLGPRIGHRPVPRQNQPPQWDCERPHLVRGPAEYVRLIRKVISVSLETGGIVEGLLELGVGEEVVEGVGMSEPAIMTASAGAHRAMLDVSSLRNLDHRCRLMKPPRI